MTAFVPDSASMPSLIYGTAWKKERTRDLVIQAFKAGFRGFDTACQPRHYAEPLVGAALMDLKSEGVSRRDYYLQTKYSPPKGQDPETIPYDPNVSVSIQVAKSFEVSLANLQTDYLDALILHSPLATAEETIEAWKAMETIVRQGGVLRLGISNCYNLNVLQSLYDLAEIKPVIVQNRFYDQTGYDIPLRAWCLAHDIVYQSFWTLTANPHLLSHVHVETLGDKYGKEPAQILFNYLRQKGVTPLTGTTDIDHMRLDLASFDVDFTDAELSLLDKML
ncbi:MAG: aldo/keto reductase [Pseudomonadales bacterium]|nr:aldo/keto reductase [Pseudomonadales bacterium]